MWLKRPVYRSKARLAWVRSMSCLHCFAPPPSEAHHYNGKGNGSMGKKCGDDLAVPLCTACHRHFHDTGTLLGLTPQLTRSDFVKEQNRLAEAWAQKVPEGVF